MTTPRLLSERYELGDTLGYGGMSEVHRGLDTRLGRDVAVKVLRADLARDPQFQLRFRREAQNAAALNHPAIVAVYDTGETTSEFGPLPYIVMEFVDGHTLREIVKTQGPLDQGRVLDVMADVCAALDFSHRHNIIHRDVKPANIMINTAGAVKVMDFGIARALGEGQNVTQTAAVIGTAQYLSPEQARGEAVDARSDVYAAGCVLFELLTGDPPFTGDTPVAVAYQHVREDPRHPSALNPAVPPELDAIVLKALSKNPANRYQSAAEMRADLIRVRNGQRPQAPLVMSDDERTALLAANATTPTRRIGGAGRHTLPPDAVPAWRDEEPPPRTGRKIAIVVGIVAVLALIAFVAYQFFGGPPSPKQVTVPDVVGQQQEAARTAVINAGLRADIEQTASTPDQVNKVVKTDPAGNTQIAENSTVKIFIGSGPAQSAVPPIVGLSVSDAQAQLQERGLTLGQQTEQETSDPSMVGKIISSNPAPGTNADAGTPVAVVVGKQPSNVSVPDVTGQDADSARSALTKAGFQVQVQGDTSGDAVVTGMNPSAGTKVAKGTTVTITMGSSNSGNQVQMPNLVGMDVASAQAAVQQAGLTNVRRQNVPVNDRSQDGKIQQQTVPAGQQIDKDQQVTVLVGQYSVIPSGGGGN
ncbi:Stk1 family PASTA domain-containing Ser/Thr kinase [Pseudonocardia dioxanivorans]|uniref:Stk1 family PASTA domain-containing Ser/Thr kinase n=1 Tax=Pseudonocardia dioxanivorans TaxID=240495 RepID=UPI000CD32076|nr:Stk1 family PASTA domain-containing Ser/Thr kinase [Pseudonocardia dioxanivorans]